MPIKSNIYTKTLHRLVFKSTKYLGLSYEQHDSQHNTKHPQHEYHYIQVFLILLIHVGDLYFFYSILLEYV